MAGAISAQRPASQTAIGIRKIELGQQRHDDGREEKRAEERRDALGAPAGRRASGPTGRPSSISSSARAQRGLDEPETEQRQRRPDREDEEGEEPVALTAGLDAEDARRVQVRATAGA